MLSVRGSDLPGHLSPPLKVNNTPSPIYNHDSVLQLTNL
jgi:hypothetical protein